MTKSAQLQTPQLEDLEQLMLDHSTAGLVAYGPDGRVLHANELACHWLGLSYDPTVGRWSQSPGWSLSHAGGDPLQPEEHPARRALATRQPVRDTVIGVEADGGNRMWLHLDAVPALGVDGELDCIVTTLTDITSEKPDETMQQIAATLPGTIYAFKLHTDGTASLPHCTPAFEDLWGLRPEEVREDFARGFARFHPHDLPRVHASIAESARSLSPWRETFRVLNPVRGEIWVEANSLPWVEPDGSVVWHGFAHDVTERKRAEENLGSAKAFLDSLMDLSPFPMWVADREGTIVRVNRSLSETGGAAEGTFVGRYNVLRDENLEICGLMPKVRAVFEKHAPARLVFPWRASRVGDPQFESLHDVFVDASMFPIVNSQGELDHVVCQWLDITDRIKADADLRKAERYLARIFGVSPVGTITTRVSDGLVIEVSDTYLDVFGYTREEVVGRTVIELGIWADPKDRDNYTRELMSEGLVERTEMRFRRKSGEIGIGMASAELIEINGERCLLSLLIDITERKRAEEESRTLALRLRAAMDSMTDAVFISDAQGRLIAHNEAFVTFQGLVSKEERFETEERPAELLEVSGNGGEPLPPEEWIGPTALRGESGRNVERLVRRKDTGETRVTSWSYGPIRDPDGTIVGAVGAGRDITDQKRAEAERASLHEQLLQAQKMESVGRLAGGVAHDFNNILMVQKGYCELMRLCLREGDPLAESLDQIETYVDRATALTRQLLAFSRKQALNPVVVDLNLLLTNVEDMLRRLIGEDIDLITVPASYPAQTLADPGQLEQVLANLAVNARDAMPDGGTLRIGISHIEVVDGCDYHYANLARGPYVEVTVSDTGVGMDSETQRRIFEPFFTTKGEGQGTGLGLSTTYGIIRQSGGDIWVESRPRRGATFQICLPSTASAHMQSVTKESTEIMGHGELILVVEDEPALRDLAVLMIEKLGYRAAAATDGNAALDAVEKEGLRPDIVLSDVVMPGMSSRMLLQRLQEAVPGLKVIHMSGHTDDAVAQRGIINTGVNFLQKPFTMHDLGEQIRSALAR